MTWFQVPVRYRLRKDNFTGGCSEAFAGEVQGIRIIKADILFAVG